MLVISIFPFSLNIFKWLLLNGHSNLGQCGKGLKINPVRSTYDKEEARGVEN